MCVDYRALNSVTRVPSYPMKDMHEQIVYGRDGLVVNLFRLIERLLSDKNE